MSSSPVSPGGEDASGQLRAVQEFVAGYLDGYLYDCEEPVFAANAAESLLSAMAESGFAVVQLPEPTAMYVDYFGSAEYTAEFALKLYASALAGLPVGEEAEKK